MQLAKLLKQKCVYTSLRWITVTSPSRELLNATNAINDNIEVLLFFLSFSAL